MKLGLYGGSFDPVHMGHLWVAEAAREEAQLDRLYFIPTAQSPFKPSNQAQTPAVRLQLLRLALAGLAWAEVDDQEIRRGGTSYTIETVRDYARRFPNVTLHYLIGADNVALLSSWRQAEELASLARFLIIPRPGINPSALPAPFRGQTLAGTPTALSSSQIRQRIKSGKSIRHFVPDAVQEAVANNRLYL
jgi:nicotinate-nucleotide adenylyltransferase